MRKVVSIFMCLVGAAAAAGLVNGISVRGGLVWFAIGAVIGLWNFIKGAVAEGKEAEAEAVARYYESRPVPAVEEPKESIADAFEDIDPSAYIVMEPEAVEGVTIGGLINTHRLPKKVTVKVMPLADPVEEEEEFDDYDIYCRYKDNLGKEKERLERVLEGLRNKKDKYIYQGVGTNTQKWRGLEYDIDSCEKRLEILRNF